MEFKEHIQITKQVKDQFESLKKTLLFSPEQRCFIIINDFNIEDKEVIKKGWSIFGSVSSKSTEHFLTSATILVWNTDRKSWGVLNETGVNVFLSYDTPQIMRDYYLNRIKAPLENLGISFKIKSVNE